MLNEAAGRRRMPATTFRSRIAVRALTEGCRVVWVAIVIVFAASSSQNRSEEAGAFRRRRNRSMM